MIKNYLISYGYLFSLIFILSIILSIINYYINIPIDIFKILILVISIFIPSIILGKNSNKLGYLEGIKFSSIYLIFITILKFILKTSFNFKIFIIYILLIFSSVIGSMIGINLKKDKK